MIVVPVVSEKNIFKCVNKRKFICLCWKMQQRKNVLLWIHFHALRTCRFGMAFQAIWGAQRRPMRGNWSRKPKKTMDGAKTLVYLYWWSNMKGYGEQKEQNTPRHELICCKCSYVLLPCSFRKGYHGMTENNWPAKKWWPTNNTKRTIES